MKRKDHAELTWVACLRHLHLVNTNSPSVDRFNAVAVNQLNQLNTKAQAVTTQHQQKPLTAGGGDGAQCSEGVGEVRIVLVPGRQQM